MTIATLPVRVLNASYEDLGPTTLDRALALVEVQGRAEIIMVDDTKTIRTMGGREFFLPKIIRLLTFKKVRFHYAPEIWSRDGVIKRDGAICAYCGKTGGVTVDHILAQSLGGKDEWMNTVACCHKCNGAKSNLTMEEWGKPVLFEMTEERMVPKKMYFKSDNPRRKRKKDR